LEVEGCIQSRLIMILLFLMVIFLNNYVCLADHNNKIELGKMLQLVLGCAMNCEDKERKWTLIKEK